MPTPTKGPRLGGSPQHQRLLLSNLATALFEHGKIRTTQAKAKALRPVAERLITFAKRGDLHARRQVLTVVRDKDVVHTLFAEIGPRFAERPGGYTRITKVGPRKGDNAPMAVIELVEAKTVAQQAVGEAEKARGTRFVRRKGGSAAAASATSAVAAEATTGVAVGGPEEAADQRGTEDTAEVAEPAAPGGSGDDTAAAGLGSAPAEEPGVGAPGGSGDDTAAVGLGSPPAEEPGVGAPGGSGDTASGDTASGDTASGAGNQAESADQTSQAEGESDDA